METMQDYTTYCTEAQAKKAYYLGAPLDKHNYIVDGACKKPHLIGSNGHDVLIPTTQQMIGWLIEKGFGFQIDTRFRNDDYYRVSYKYMSVVVKRIRMVKKGQAELAAIDAALDYLEKRKSNE